MSICSYAFGKVIRKTNFDLRIYNKSAVIISIIISFISLISYIMLANAIEYIPLTISSCLSFTTGPIFGWLLAFVFLQETLNYKEVVCIVCGIIGALMITMP